MPGRWKSENDKCLAKTRRGTHCQCLGLQPSGRCRFHGGMSTGPKTAAGKATATQNLPWYKKRQAKSDDL